MQGLIAKPESIGTFEKGTAMKKAGIIGSIAAAVLFFATGICVSMQKPAAKPADSVIEPNRAVKKPLIQMAILLDTSSSMNGLINQARSEIWSLVNEAIFTKKNGLSPEVQVALYEYGKSTLRPEEGFIRQILPFTLDLDKVSEELFALTTNGGQEYCGWVIKDALDGLQWSQSKDDYKVIFIAGNEPFTQGKVDFKESCKAAIAKGIIVNTIHCGSINAGVNGKWNEGASLADGQYLNIDQNIRVAAIVSPQDKTIIELGAKLNSTYVPYGLQGRSAAGRQFAQDRNAGSMGSGAAVERVVTKSSDNYINIGWDLVDAVKNNKVKLEDLKSEDLPENMRSMSLDEKKAYIEAMAKEREEIQAEIRKLDSDRQQYIAAEIKNKPRNPGAGTFGGAAAGAARGGMGGMGFSPTR
jgi:hypothetical protein